MKAKIPASNARSKNIYVRLPGHLDSEIRAFAAQKGMTLTGTIDLACEQFLRDQHMLAAFQKMLDERLPPKE